MQLDLKNNLKPQDNYQGHAGRPQGAQHEEGWQNSLKHRNDQNRVLRDQQPPTQSHSVERPVSGKHKQTKTNNAGPA